VTRVAVLIPCFDDGALTAEAVASVREDEPIEIVVIDDASSDPETLAVLGELERAGVRVARHEDNRGVGEARMTGLAASSAPFVFPLDSDDLAVPGSLAAMADILGADPGAAVCFGDYDEFGESRIVRAVPDRIDPYRLAYINEYPISSLFRRSWLERVGGWRGGGYTGRSYEDWNLWMALAEAGARGIHAGPELVVYRRRLHGARKLQAGKRHHRELYRQLRAAHPRLFADLGAHRRASDLAPGRRLLYPLVYGARRRFPFEARIKRLLDRAGIWTLRRG
jgi:glycosyltransferase involved in cell wall biosynthesis